MSSDTYVCSICHIKVKTKLARAHEKGAKHVAKLRAQTAPKRPAPNDLIEIEPSLTPTKKVRTHEDTFATPSVAAPKPAGAAEEEEAAVSGLPANFFEADAKKQEANAEANMDKEMAKFMDEINQIEKKEEEITDREDALRNDLEMIDEQINMWNNVNELDKQKEQALAEARARLEAAKQAAANGTSKQPAHESDDDDDDVDLFDWRTRRI